MPAKVSIPPALQVALTGATVLQPAQQQAGSRVKPTLQDFLLLGKVRLASLVVVCAGLGYLIVANSVNWVVFTALLLGGSLVTASANALNQLAEARWDKLMHRTAQRPLPAGRMLPGQARLFALFTGIAGQLLLWLAVNPLCGLLSLLSLISYAFIYTPLKRISSFAVFVGAIPGAISPLLGCVAAQGRLSQQGLILFLIQFIWQFPHFWAIAWVAHDDYQRAGFHLLPSRAGRDGLSAFQIASYALLLLPLGYLPYATGIAGWPSAVVLVVVGLGFFFLTLRLLQQRTLQAARNIMFGSFLYLPLALLALYLDKI